MGKLCTAIIHQNNAVWSATVRLLIGILLGGFVVLVTAYEVCYEPVYIKKPQQVESNK